MLCILLGSLPYLYTSQVKGKKADVLQLSCVLWLHVHGDSLVSKRYYVPLSRRRNTIFFLYAAFYIHERPND